VRLVEESNDLARDVLPASLLVVHDTGGGGQDDVTELTGGKELDNPLLELREADVVTGRDNTSLVETKRFVSTTAEAFESYQENLPAVKLDNNLARAVVIDLLELANVA
jgi:hypothetical protein